MITTAKLCLLTSFMLVFGHISVALATTVQHDLRCPGAVTGHSGTIKMAKDSALEVDKESKMKYLLIHLQNRIKIGAFPSKRIKTSPKVEIYRENMSIRDEDVLQKYGYRLGVTLGDGSYGCVKRAFSVRLEKDVAVKIINKRVAGKDFLQRFLPRELAIVQRLKHPNIVKVYQIIDTPDKVYTVMEEAPHGDLLEYVQTRGAMSERRARETFRELAEAVSYCHAQDICHRDLKCENILLDAHGHVKLTDFGFARDAPSDDRGRPTLSQTYCGSAAYASPEVLRGKPYQPSSYDIWSLGVVLYIMVCGTMPFDDSNVRKMLRKQMDRKLNFSSTRVISQECKALIAQMLTPDVSHRPTIDEVLNSRWLRTTPSAPPTCSAAWRLESSSQPSTTDSPMVAR
ncbi:TSSK1B [Branchiostoma lanceolatum]|uniref:non-specific serine/threonine protein kinase n=2 Tax=Branchiostoma lanceolatum TaxID=7740 RepID=A0A8J9VAA7_BRALA|nr:TSSK1B [Branchiostoma lanceolatum]